MTTNLVLTLLLPWFPVVLAVGVGGRLLGRTHGFAMGTLCALFWIVLGQASAGPGLWSDPWHVATIVTGAVAIVAIGGWAGETPVGADGGTARWSLGSQRTPARAAQSGYPPNPTAAPTSAAETELASAAVQRMSDVVEEFDDWLDEHRGDPEIWARFDEFARSALYKLCKASHVRCYRLVGEPGGTRPGAPESNDRAGVDAGTTTPGVDPAGHEVLVSLCDIEQSVDTAVSMVSARRGIVGHVVTTGRPYIAGDPTHGELLFQLATVGSAEHDESDTHGVATHLDDRTAWAFPIRRGPRRLGVIVVGHLGISTNASGDSRQLLRHAERLLNQFWCLVLETSRSRRALETDPVSGLPTRSAFLHAAEMALTDAYRQGEPVAIVMIGFGGLRRLGDTGRWELADLLIREVATRLRQKVRMDDRLGRFDESRLVVLLRRVDSELASLIVNQIMTRVIAVCRDPDRWGMEIDVHCGVVGSGIEQPPLPELLRAALQQCGRARKEGLLVASDVGSGHRSADRHPAAPAADPVSLPG
ncbi:MAG: diguanylate cyclase [Phycisphaerae bacterium]|jgi:diguanylate cyclase (GGDEF)-like protein